jgi:hypothetical protein
VAFAPFDPTATDLDEDGHALRYLDTPLDHEYRVAPPNWVAEGMLPPEDFEVRRAIVEMKLATEHWIGLGFWPRLIGTTAAKHAKAFAVEKQRELRALVQTSPAHKAALRRSIYSMPEDSGGREVPASYLQLVRITNGRF